MGVKHRNLRVGPVHQPADIDGELLRLERQSGFQLFEIVGVKSGQAERGGEKAGSELQRR
jgi:hypothetical protein